MSASLKERPPEKESGGPACYSRARHCHEDEFEREVDQLLRIVRTFHYGILIQLTRGFLLYRMPGRVVLWQAALHHVLDHLGRTL